MSTEVQDYVSVSEKLKTLGISPPCGLSILPSNFAVAENIEDFRQEAESDTVRTLLKANKIAHVEIFDENHQPPYLQQYSFEWFGPTLFISANLLSQDTNILSVTLGVITNYLYDLFKGTTNGSATLDIILEHPDGSCKKIHYSGPPDGLGSISNIINELGSKQ